LDALAVKSVLARQLRRSLPLLALVQANVAVTFLGIFRLRWQILDLLLGKPPRCLLALRHTTNGTKEEFLQRNATTTVVLRPKLPEIREKLPELRVVNIRLLLLLVSLVSSHLTERLVMRLLRLLVNVVRLLDRNWNTASQMGRMTDCAHLGRLTVLVDRNGD